MFIVAVTRWGKPFDDEIADLSVIAGIHPYDLRLRLSGVLPAVVASFSDAEDARHLMVTLKERSHGAVAIDLDKVPGADEIIAPKTFDFDDTNIKFADPVSGPETILYESILALIHAQQETVTRVTSIDESRKFSASRAVITGGLVVTKKSKKEKREIGNAYEQVLYIFRKPCKLAFVLRQNRLLYSGLGDQIRHSSVENFLSLVGLLRERASGALYDNRLLKRWRGAKLEQISLSHAAADKSQSRVSESMSNALEVDVVAHLIAVAHQRGQL